MVVVLENDLGGKGAGRQIPKRGGGGGGDKRPSCSGLIHLPKSPLR